MSQPATVICGGGIAGIAAAYFLSVEHGQNNVIIVEQDNVLSMTSDKSSEGYRNWWPGPDWQMTAYMNRSIDLMEGIARATGNRINMSRRGYLYVTADKAKLPWLIQMAKSGEERGSGPVRVHDRPDSPYVPASPTGFDSELRGSDVITDKTLIQKHFPFLNPETVGVIHARRAGWISAQQLGMTMLEAARERGVKLVRGRMVSVDHAGGKLRSVDIDRDGKIETIAARHLVVAAGPMLPKVADMLGVKLPVYPELHKKISVPDTLGIARGAPMTIWLDEQKLPWSEEEKAALAEDEETRWLLDTFPPGVHGRPDGGHSGGPGSLLLLFSYKDERVDDVVFPLPDNDPNYREITLRGMTRPIPGLQAYVDSGVRPFVDGGYYMRTRENRPLICPLPIEGVFLSGAFSGFGIMASCAGGELVAKYVTGKPLPDYAPAFHLSRYDDPAYQKLLDRWGDDGQL
jgi:glycine/D-amino acid oxidase-like deaminating enzyme